MEFVCFKNSGVLEPDFIKSFGVSVKSDESCIGFFGTGLKYALAILIRRGAKISIYSGGETMRFGKETSLLKGKSFDFVTMNGEKLPFTTELGKTWEPWMAYRELYSNAKDEGGDAVIISDLPSKSDDMTYIVIAGGGIEELHKQRTSIFIDGSSAIESNVFEGGGSFYSKGVCVWKYEDMPSLYSYNDPIGYCDLTEDRQIKYQFDVSRCVSNAIASLTNKDILERIICADRGVYESRVDFDYCTVNPTSEFMEIAQTYKDDCNNASIVSFVEKHTPRKPLEEFELSERQKSMVDDAIFQVRMAGFTIDDFPIKYVVSLKDNALGMAKGGAIYISQDVFLIGGMEMLKVTLIEEWVHLKHNLKDCDRKMQNYLFEQIVRLIDTSNSIAQKKYAA